MSPRGSLIVVEGLDRSGKTSQCQILHDEIEKSGVSVKLMKFPDRSNATGRMINDYLQGRVQQDDHAIHLLFSANRWEASQGMLSDLEKGTSIIVDRYSFSGAVYSAAKRNPNLSLEWAWSPEIGLPMPDLVIFLDISAEDAAKRGGYGEERYEKEEMQKNVRSLFKQLFKRMPHQKLQIIDAGSSLSDVSKAVWSAYHGTEQPGVSMHKLTALQST